VARVAAADDGAPTLDPIKTALSIRFPVGGHQTFLCATHDELLPLALLRCAIPAHGQGMITRIPAAHMVIARS
jgi:hypothetical protein